MVKLENPDVSSHDCAVFSHSLAVLAVSTNTHVTFWTQRIQHNKKLANLNDSDVQIMVETHGYFQRRLSPTNRLQMHFCAF